MKRDRKTWTLKNTPHEKGYGSTTYLVPPTLFLCPITWSRKFAAKLFLAGRTFRRYA